LLDEVQALLDRAPEGVVADLLVTPSSRSDWEHARQILCNDLGIRAVTAALGQLPGMLETIARDVEASKAKDDERGVRIIDDYQDAHVSAANDPFVCQVHEEMRRMKRDIESVLERLACARANHDTRLRPPVSA